MRSDGKAKTTRVGARISTHGMHACSCGRRAPARDASVIYPSLVEVAVEVVARLKAEEDVVARLELRGRIVARGHGAAATARWPRDGITMADESIRDEHMIKTAIATG